MTTRRAYLQDLVKDLRRYLSWQEAQGVAGIVPAKKEHRQILEAKKSALQKKKLQALRSQITGQDEPSPPPSPDLGAPRRERAPASEERASAQVSEGVTATTPLWQRHQAIYELDKRREPAPPKKERRAPSPPPQKRAAQAGRSVPETPPEKMAFLREYLADCRRCPLHQGRTNVVFGEGDPFASLMFIGEAPGFHEDQQGRPFVGKSGKLLTDMIRAMGYGRDEVYIANIIKCRPPENRNPAPEEIRRCSPFLKKQIEVIAPRVIITLGRFATNTLLDSDESLGTMRGRWHSFQQIPVMPTYHPAYLLRSPEQKRQAWSDLQMVMKRLGLRQ